MHSKTLVTILALSAAIDVGAQSADAPLAFEAATVKLAKPGMTGLPGARSPGQVTFRKQLKSIVAFAYKLESYQLECPAWMEDTIYDIVAKVPPGSSQAEIKRMLQTLLAERLRLTVHRIARDLPIYELNVSKSGARIHPPSAASEMPPTSEPGIFVPRGKLQQDGFPARPPSPNGGIATMFINGRAKMVVEKQTLEEFADVLSGSLQRPVIDRTGLRGKYDFVLYYVPEQDLSTDPDAPPPPAGETLFAAMQKQLGLKLDPARGPVKILVVDAQKVPIEN